MIQFQKQVSVSWAQTGPEAICVAKPMAPWMWETLVTFLVIGTLSTK